MHRNTQFIGHMIDLETNLQGPSHLHPEPCVFYGTASNFPQPNIHSIVPAPGNPCNFNYQHIPEHHDSALFYGVTQYNAVQHQPPASNLDLAVAAPSGHYNPYVAPPSGIRDFHVPVNHGAHDQLSLSSTHRTVGNPTESYRRIIPYSDGVRDSFKRKNAEGVPGNYYYHNALAGPSSFAAPVTSRPTESDAAAFLLPEFAGNDLTSTVESGSHRSTSNRPGLVGPESVLAHNTNHLIQGNHVAQPVQFPGNPWLDMRFTSGDNGTCWNQALNSPYVNANINGPYVDAGNIGIQGYQMTAINRSSTGFLHSPIAQGHPHLHHPPPPMQGVRRYNNNFPSQVATSSRRTSTISSSNTGVNALQDVADAGPTFLAPVLPTGFRLYQPHRRELILDPNSRHDNLPLLRVLPEDGVAMLEIPGYNEAGDSTDQHWDMRLDIDHMSYEELLALGEQIGSVGIGLSEEAIQNNLRTRTFTSLKTCSNVEEAARVDQKVNLCVICQTDYEDQENIGILDCGHECHGDCIKKWLLVKNTCPICKSIALIIDGKYM
ncbi:RING/U-box superfamily protein [Forsythia ovata]|uniref:RING-type E3 ubiquitin transferase n=1 Tax=Forsythia ovata TaxID=205694 RepID=A0ABD1R698_9LAMI